MNGTTAAAPPEAGIQFPAAADGSRSTTQAGARIVAAALGALGPAGPALAAAALGERHWRRAYPRHFRALVEHGLPSADAALASARAGLDAAWGTLQWASPGAQDMRLDEAFGQRVHTPLREASLTGRGDPAPAPWLVPLRGQLLGGERLLAQIADWQERHIIEPSAARALARCVAHPEWFDLSDRTLALLGAGSEAGPLRWLARWRARIVALDLPRADVWRRIAGVVEAGNATLVYPLGAQAPSDDVAHAGVDLMRDTPAAAEWLARSDQALDVACLGYLDGERHVRISLAMDWVVRTLMAQGPRHGFAWMATPTDVFAVPQATAVEAMRRFAQRPAGSRLMQGGLRLASGDRFFQPGIDGLVQGPEGLRYGIADSLVLEQGPNYALAKRLQQWRALDARARGHRVALNVAPSTTTASVVKNPALAAGFAGADTFGVEVFEPETTNALVAALWVHDLRCDDSPANPARALAHPFELFMQQACHGGLWTCAYLPRSALPFAAALGWVRQKMR